MATTWTIAIDWHRDGKFSQPNDDVTDYVLSANWFLGNRQPYQEMADNSMLTLELNNADKRFSPENGSSPLAGKLTPFKSVRIQSDDGTTVRTHWIGWIDSLQPTVNENGKRQVTLTAQGPMQFMKAAETRLALQENQRTDQIVAALLDEVVIPPALTGAWIVGRAGNTELGTTTFLADTSSYSELDAGQTTLVIAGDNWVRQGGLSSATEDTFNVYRAIWDVVAAERGRFMFSRDGKALFWNRHKFLDEVALADSFDNTMQDLAYVYASGEDFKNEIVVMCHPRTISSSSTEILWQLADEIRIPAEDTRTIYAKYQDASGNRIGGKNVTTDGAVFSEGSATITFDARANSAQLTITNNGSEDATLTALTIKGQKITDFGRMEATATDTASIMDYGRRTLKLNLPAVDNFDGALNIAQFEKNRRRQPRGRVNAITLRSHAAISGGHQANQLALTLGDRISIEENQTEHSASYFIIGEAHHLREGGQLFETTWYVEPAPATFPWKLGVSGRSELGESTVLTY